MSEVLVQDTSLTAIADAIRKKASTTGSLVFPEGFVDAITALSTFSGGSLSAIDSGTITAISVNAGGCTVTHSLGVVPTFSIFLLDKAATYTEKNTIRAQIALKIPVHDAPSEWENILICMYYDKSAKKDYCDYNFTNNDVLLAPEQMHLFESDFGAYIKTGATYHWVVGALADI